MPKININLNENKISIKTDDLKIRKKIETYSDQLSSALPDNFVVGDYFITNSGSEFIINFEDINKDTQAKFESLPEYLEHIDKLNKMVFEIDGKHLINLIDYPHFLIAGSTGSGKSYLTQLLAIQFIKKGYEVSIFDVKKSYSAFADFVDYETEPAKIIEKLKLVSEEMVKRQNELSEVLKYDPRALAIDRGYKQKIIIIEEFIGLKTLLSKDEIKELDNIIKSISVLARSVNISIFLIAQSSSVDLIDSSIKNNLNKIFLGYLASNIAVSTFGNGVEVPAFTEIKKGYGYIQLNRIEQIKVPFVKYSVRDLNLLTRNQAGNVPKALSSESNM